MTNPLRLLVAPLILLTLAACAGSPTAPSLGQHDIELGTFELRTQQVIPLYRRTYFVCGGMNSETQQELVLQDLTVDLRDSSGQAFYTQSLPNFPRSMGSGDQVTMFCFGVIDDPDPTRTAAAGVVRLQYSRTGGPSRVVEGPAVVLLY